MAGKAATVNNLPNATTRTVNLNGGNWTTGSNGGGDINAGTHVIEYTIPLQKIYGTNTDAMMNYFQFIYSAGANRGSANIKITITTNTGRTIFSYGPSGADETTQNILYVGNSALSGASSLNFRAECYVSTGGFYNQSQVKSISIVYYIINI